VLRCGGGGNARRHADMTFREAAMRMLRDGGLRPFFNGITPTVVRDSVFGGVYIYLKVRCCMCV
jgi:hypothetical protein